MALWTPYKQEEPIDLSKHAVSGERDSPLSASSAPYLPLHLALYPTYLQEYRNSFQFSSSSHHYQPATQTVPSGLSPDSIASSSHSNVAEPLPSTSQICDTESLNDDLEYQIFERDAMRAMAEKNGGSILGNNPRMRRAVQTNRTADDLYKTQREKNNFAAKQSRDRRKLREVRLALQVTYLKKKVAELTSRQICGRCRQVYK